MGCGRRDSNPHGLRHRHLKPACLPVPPRPREAPRAPARGLYGPPRGAAGSETVLEYPNRDKASSKIVKWIVVLLLLGSAALVAIVSVGGWDALRGAKALQVA